MYKGFSIYDFCALFIVLGLILSIFIRKVWKDTTTRLFLRCLIICAIAIIENIFFVKIISRPLTKELVVTAIILKNLYYIALLIIMVAIYIYMLSTMGLLYLLRNKKNSFFRLSISLLFIIPFIYIILSIPNQWIFHVSIENGYVMKYGTHLLFSFFIMVLFLGIMTVIIFRKYLTRLKLIDCFILYPINILSLFYQVFHPEYSLVMFVITMSFYVISITTLRAETLINPTLNAKTSLSYYKDTESSFTTQNNKIHIFIKIVNHSQIRKYIGNKYYIQFLKNISGIINNIISEYKVHIDFYYLEDSEFAVVLEQSYLRYVDKISNLISEYFYNEYDFLDFKVYPDVRTCIVQLPNEIDNYDYLVYFAKVFHHIVPNEKTPVYYGKIAKNKEFKIKNDIINIINGALKNDRFKVYFQPVYSLVEKRYVSAEALIRLTDPVYGEVNPDLFIPVSEISGDIIEIGDIVMKKVLAFISSKDFKDTKLKYIEVNLTLAQCMVPDFAEKVLSLLKEYNVAPDKIHFEITENMEGYNVEVIENNLNKLHENGIVFELDDYGMGYSNIKQVLELPVDIVKLDKSFIEEIEDEQMLIVITDTITMLRNLGKSVLIEGIESNTLLDFFSLFRCKVDGKDEPVIGCEYVQGYLFSKPLPQQDFIQFINS